jgi:hypothetical protein
MIGEVVGKAASICLKNGCTPRVVYERYFTELQELMNLRGAARRENVNAPITLPEGYTPPPPLKIAEPAPTGIAPASLGGIVVDDEQAKLTGTWAKGHGMPDYVGIGYQYAPAKSKATARYEFTIVKGGRYEVRANYGANPNRATNAPVTIESADGKKNTTINERADATPNKGFVSLGVFRFEPGKPAAVTFRTEGADGQVHIDAVQLLPH